MIQSNTGARGSNITYICKETPYRVIMKYRIYVLIILALLLLLIAVFKDSIYRKWDLYQLCCTLETGDKDTALKSILRLSTDYRVESLPNLCNAICRNDVYEQLAPILMERGDSASIYFNNILNKKEIRHETRLRAIFHLWYCGHIQDVDSSNQIIWLAELMDLPIIPHNANLYAFKDIVVTSLDDDVDVIKSLRQVIINNKIAVLSHIRIHIDSDNAQMRDTAYKWLIRLHKLSPNKESGYVIDNIIDKLNSYNLVDAIDAQLTAGDKRNVPRLIACLADRDHQIRYAAIRIIDKHVVTEAIPNIKTLLNDNTMSREYMIKVLSRLSEPKH